MLWKLAYNRVPPVCWHDEAREAGVVVEVIVMLEKCQCFVI